MRRRALAPLLGLGLLIAMLIGSPPSGDASWVPLERTPVEEDGDPEQPGATSQSPSDDREALSEGDLLESLRLFEATLDTWLEVLML